jgi:hypothetical protein
MSWIEVTGYGYPGGWVDKARAEGLARECCERLEEGRILYFPGVPYAFGEGDREALLSKRQSGLKVHKNISYRPRTGVVRGFDSGGDAAELRRIMGSFSQGVSAFVRELLMPYAGTMELDYASFRPLEEDGRELALHKRNDLVHVDSFPTRPTGGGRILRCFTNINPSETRNWMTAADDFPTLAGKYALEAGLKKIAKGSRVPGVRLMRGAQAMIRRAMGLPGTPRTGYDQFMLRFHDWMKEDESFQKESRKVYSHFPPGSTWLVYTDAVAHAVLSGKFAIEQTFIVPIEVMVKPEISPVRVLEGLAGEKMGM